MVDKGFIRQAGTNHPLHPAIVHFPITLFPLSSVFLVLWFWLETPFFLHAAYWAFLFGALVIVPVVLTGIRDMRHTHPESRQGEKMLYTHMIVGGLIAFLSLLSGVYYLLNKPILEAALIPGFAVITFLVTLLVFVQGFIGGVLVYSYHVGISGRTTSS